MPLDMAAIRRCKPRREDVEILVHFAESAVIKILSSRNHQDIEDVLAETVVTFFRDGVLGMAQLRNEEHTKRLFRRIAKFKAYDFLRREARRHEDAYGDPPELPADLEPSLLKERAEEIRLALGLPADANLEALLNALIEAAELEGLEPELLKHHITGRMTQRKFAERYGMRPGSVGALVRKVLKKLRRIGLGG